MDTSLLLAAMIVAPAMASFGWVVAARRFDPHPFDRDRPPWVIDDAPGHNARDDRDLGFIRFEIIESEMEPRKSPVIAVEPANPTA